MDTAQDQDVLNGISMAWAEDAWVGVNDDDSDGSGGETFVGAGTTAARGWHAAWQILARGTTRPPEGLHCVLVGATCMPIRTIHARLDEAHAFALCFSIGLLLLLVQRLSSCCVSCMCIFVACFIPLLGA